MNIAITLVPDYSFPFPHLWTGTRLFSDLSFFQFPRTPYTGIPVSKKTS